MSPRLRITLTVAVAAAILAVLALNVAWPVTTDAYDETPWMWVTGLMGFPVAAALVLSHRPDNRVGWALGCAALSAGLIFIMTWYGARFPDAPLSAEIEAVERVPGVGQFAAIVSLLYIFPTGRCVSRFYARAFTAFIVTMTVFGTLLVFSPSPLVVTGRENPFGVLPAWMGSIGDEGGITLLPFALIGLWSLVVRWRQAKSVERSQLKWFLSGAVFAVTIFILANATPDGDESAAVEFTAGSLVVAAFWSMPAAIVVSILRYRLYDIDRVINRTLVYGSLTAVLAAVYAGLVVGLQELLRPLSGGSDLAIVVTTLTVAALFMPARSRVQVVVDRRFNRRQYDAALTVDAFSARLRQQIELDTLRYELLAVIDETMAPSRASIWLRSREPGR